MPSVVQTKSGSIASGTSLVITFDGTTVAGNTLVAMIQTGGASVSSVSGGGTWTETDASAVQAFCAIWSCPNATAITQVTVTISGSNTANGRIVELGGVLAASVDTFDAAGSGGGTATITTATITPSTPSNIVLALGASSCSYVSGSTGGWTDWPRIEANGLYTWTAYLVQTSATNASTSWVDSNSGFGWDTVIAAYKGAVPVWTTPADTVSMSTTPELKFNSPASAVKQHFYLQLDTSNGFASGDLRSYDSSTSQTNWAYWDGAAWTAMPSDGLPIAKSGNEIRYTVTSALSSATWYRRVRAGTLV